MFSLIKNQKQAYATNRCHFLYVFPLLAPAITNSPPTKIDYRCSCMRRAQIKPALSITIILSVLCVWLEVTYDAVGKTTTRKNHKFTRIKHYLKHPGCHEYLKENLDWIWMRWYTTPGATTQWTAARISLVTFTSYFFKVRMLNDNIVWNKSWQKSFLLNSTTGHPLQDDLQAADSDEVDPTLWMWSEAMQLLCK